MEPARATCMACLFEGRENGAFPALPRSFYLKGVTAALYLLNPWDVFNG